MSTPLSSTSPRDAIEGEGKRTIVVDYMGVVRRAVDPLISTVPERSTANFRQPRRKT